MLLRLDSLRYDPFALGMDHRYKLVKIFVLAPAIGPHKTLVDLDIIHRQTHDTTDIGIAGSKIIQCETIGSFRTAKIKEEVHDKRTVELLVQDERQALERVMMQFSIYQKATERIEENSYRITLTYEAEDEIDLMIQILSFGTSLKVAGPEAFVEQIKNRLEMQKRCGH